VERDQFTRLLVFIQRLDAAHLSHRLPLVRPESVCVEVVVPGQRWEVEFMPNGSVEVERFISNGDIADESALEVLFADFAD